MLELRTHFVCSAIYMLNSFLEAGGRMQGKKKIHYIEVYPTAPSGDHT